MTDYRLDVVGDLGGVDLGACILLDELKRRVDFPPPGLSSLRNFLRQIGRELGFATHIGSAYWWYTAYNDSLRLIGTHRSPRRVCWLTGGSVRV